MEIWVKYIFDEPPLTEGCWGKALQMLYWRLWPGWLDRPYWYSVFSSGTSSIKTLKTPKLVQEHNTFSFSLSRSKLLQCHHTHPMQETAKQKTSLNWKIITFGENFILTIISMGSVCVKCEAPMFSPDTNRVCVWKVVHGCRHGEVS